MNKTGTTILGVLALGLGWLLGAQTGGGSADATNAEIVRLQDENAQFRRLLGERGPRLPPVVGLKGSAPRNPGEAPASGSPASTSHPDVTSFDITTFDDADQAFQAFLAYAATMLAKGEEGHLALLEAISRNFADKPGEQVLKEMLGNEEQALRYLYPLIRFAMNHDAEVVDMTETVFKTMAKDPQRLRDVDNDPIGLFTEGVAVMLPGMVDAKRLERFRAYAVGMLETPEAEQPRSVARQRRDVQRAMESWAPPISKEEALERLRRGDVAAEEAMSLLRRLGPDDVRGLDLDALVGPLLERDGWRVMTLVGRLQPDADTLARLDARFLRAARTGTLEASMVPTWLRWTGRRTWEASRAFIEAGLQGGNTASNGAFLMAAVGLQPGPDDDWLDWAERTYTFEDKVRVFLKRRREQGGR